MAGSTSVMPSGVVDGYAIKGWCWRACSTVYAVLQDWQQLKECRAYGVVLAPLVLQWHH